MPWSFKYSIWDAMNRLRGISSLQTNHLRLRACFQVSLVTVSWWHTDAVTIAALVSITGLHGRMLAQLCRTSPPLLSPHMGGGWMLFWVGRGQQSSNENSNEFTHVRLSGMQWLFSKLSDQTKYKISCIKLWKNNMFLSELALIVDIL